MSLVPLDANQVALAGTNLIEASAGTGKTYAIATLYVRSLLETSACVENLLVVTYTRAATSALRDRIRRRIAETRVALRTQETADISLQALVETRIKNGEVDNDCKRLSLALRSFDQASIFTIHGFCQRCLQESAFESGTAFESEFEVDDRQLASDIADDFWANEMFDVDPSLFAFYQSRKLGPGDLRDLAKKVIGNPDLQVLPEATDASSVATGNLDAFQEHFALARSSWNENREEILGCILAHGDLKKTSYKPEQVSGKYAPAIDHLFASETAVLTGEKHPLARLSTEGLAAGKGTKKGKSPPEHGFFALASKFLAESERATAEFEAQLMALRLRLVAYVRQENTSRKLEHSTLSFDDLLLQLREALRAGEAGEHLTGAIAERYPIALIDEFQDTDPVQYEIFQRIYRSGGEAKPGRALFLIGDPKQAIYGFRGADLFTYFKARGDAEGKTHTLATNYRSSPDMVRATNAFFENPKESFLFPNLEFEGVGHAPTAENALVDTTTNSAALELLVLDRKRSDGSDGTTRLKNGTPKPVAKGAATPLCAERVAGEIVRLLRSDATLEGEPVVPGDIAVLVRTNAQAQAVQDALGTCGVPSVLESDSCVFTTGDAEELGRVLYAMAFPGDRGAIRAALATDVLGRTGNDLATLLDDEEAWEDALFSFRRWHETWTVRGFFPAFSQMMHEEGVAVRLLSRIGGERKMTNLGQLAELLQERALLSGVGPQVLCAWLDSMRVDSTARGAEGEAAQLRLETDAASVNVVTVHKSKGLEYGIVYCPFLWQGQSAAHANPSVVRFHDAQDDNRLKLDIGSDQIDDHKKHFNRETLAEDLRLLYVALTRSRHRCSVVCGVTASFGSSALAYLLLRGDELETNWSSLKDFAKRIEKLEDEELWSALQRHTDHGLGVRPLLAYEGPAYEQISKDGATLESREASRRFSNTWRTSSFTGLTRNAETERDHDAASAEQASDTTTANRGEVITMSNVPAGAHPGQMLHHIFEHIDFTEVSETVNSSDSLRVYVEESLSSFGFDPGRWSDQVVLAYEQVLRTPLETGAGGEALCLADISREQRLDELEFSVPVRPGQSHFQAEMLADALARRSAPPWPEHYLQQVRGLGFRPLRGFLRGFIDLVFEHEGRWYLVDYKSNKLGAHYGDYRPEALGRSMMERHYILQYHIYLVALDRYLRMRIEDYDYERDVGGVFYLYMRGMHAAAPRGNGIYFDKPSRDEVAALSKALGGEEAR